MSIDIEELKIKLFTNIKNEELRTIELKRSMLYHPELENLDEVLNEYPFFTFDVRYPLSRLRLLPYKERVIFFFNRQKFSDQLIAYSSEEQILDRTKIETKEDEDEYYKKRDDNIKKNVMTMLEVLLPTKFPVINDTQTSYEYIFGKSKIKPITGLIDPKITKYFSYIKVGGQIYTFKKTLWINDILNHPSYQKLVSQYRKFWIWANEEQFNRKKEINRTYPEVESKINTLFDELNKIEIKGNISGEDIKAKCKKIIEIYRLKKIMGVDYATLQKLLDNSGIYKSISTYNRDRKDKRNQIIQEIIDEIRKIIKTKEIITDKMERYKKISGIIEQLKPYCPGSECNTLLENVATKQFAKAVKLHSYISSMFTNRFDEVRENGEKDSIPFPPQYKNFAYSILEQFRVPQRESTNSDLQDLINGLDNEKTTEFYKFMEYVYDKFIFIGVKKPPGSSDRYNSLMNVGLSYLNINTTEGLRREIYVYADFIDGEVTNENMNKIFCPFVGDHLGNEFEFLVRMAIYGKTGSKDTKKWNIDRNRMIFSLKDKKSDSKKSSSSGLELEAKPLSAKKSEDQLALVPPQQGKKNLDRLRTYFMSEIVNRIDNKKALMDVIDSMTTGEQLYDEGLLDYIKKNQKDLYNIIEEWNEVIEKRNPKILDKIIKLTAQLKGEKESEEFKKKNLAVQMNDKEGALINFKVAKYNLFIAVLEELMKHENNKHQVLGGYKLSRKHRKKRNRITRRR
jgi:hypothetical protein